ncbi:hypothetical protein [Rubripirellula tenax]|uniref:hypothetical protein n=1 Tax=Rubripirellula tenax TaxID=2528015 RepID=UPI0011B57D3B|nr:hypothetical protein [Rubripirellula tenax]
MVHSQHFETDAYVGVDAGADRLPGIANVDDGFDGVVDNPVELGATGSDDRFVVMTADQYAMAPDLLPLVLQRGAWIGDDVVDSVVTSEVPRRQFFRFENRAGVWEFMKSSDVQ